ncbi:MAG: hypothetical protein ACRCV0_00115 [Brevinema sp.]
MTVYKIMRYFFFVFLIFYSLLFIFKDIVQPFPRLVIFFNELEDNYDQKIGFVKNDNQENIEKNIIEEINSIFHPYLEKNKEFSTDFRFNLTLNAAMNQYFDDFEYLVQEYFESDPNFRDLILFKNNVPLYKHRNFYTNSSLTFDCVINKDTGVSFKVVYDPKILEKLTQTYPNPLSIYYNNSQYLSASFQQIISESDLKNKIVTVDNKIGLTKISRNWYLYTTIISNVVAEPIFISSIVKRNMNFNILKLFYYLILPIFWLIVIWIDRIILRYFLFKKRITNYKKQFISSNQEKTEYDIEEALNWFDRFIKIETINEIETRISNQQQNKDTKSKDNKSSDNEH